MQRRGSVVGQRAGVGAGLQQRVDGGGGGRCPGRLVQRRIGQGALRLRVGACGQALPHLRRSSGLEVLPRMPVRAIRRVGVRRYQQQDSAPGNNPR